jgi:hypothetical protein
MRSIKKIVKLLKFMKIRISAQGPMPEKAIPAAAWEKETGARVPVRETAPEDIVFVLNADIKNRIWQARHALNKRAPNVIRL